MYPFSPALSRFLWLISLNLVGIPQSPFTTLPVIPRFRNSGSIGRGWSICLTSLLFSLIHGGNEGYSFVAFTNIFILSVVLAFVTIRTKTIWTAISFHIPWNFLQGSIFSVPVSGRETSGIYGIKLTGNDLITGGSFGIEGSIVTLVVLVVLAIILMNITSANNWRISRTINI
ncbi:CPBP family intramembrane glutamic endopeptidase [Paenibacillus sp. 1-18]|uniref:CPBP family intramembrane glutamic endopeptidase n=1 Tax=Paenibacillus sp. 1-18 TaxID=1333846 RepID=UPI0009DE0ADE|nr:CPBP family intramembrane glutamic endopeptidase [Paenibacillus sp. 1-18]